MPVLACLLVLAAPVLRVHDFGSISATRPVVHLFRLPAAPKGRVLDARADCPCTSVQVQREVAGDGDMLEVQVRLDPAEFDGPVTRQVHVRTSDPAQPEWTLEVRAQVTPQVRPTANLLTFEEVPRDAGGVGELQLKSLGVEPVRLVRVEGPAWVEVNPQPSGLDLSLEVRLHGARLPRERNQGEDLVRLHVANPEPSIVPIRIRWITAQP